MPGTSEGIPLPLSRAWARLREQSYLPCSWGATGLEGVREGQWYVTELSQWGPGRWNHTREEGFLVRSP